MRKRLLVVCGEYLLFTGPNDYDEISDDHNVDCVTLGFDFFSLVWSNSCRFYKNGEWQEVVTDTRIPCAHRSKSNVRA